jgi:hypothetical protein
MNGPNPATYIGRVGALATARCSASSHHSTVAPRWVGRRGGVAAEGETGAGHRRDRGRVSARARTAAGSGQLRTRLGCGRVIGRADRRGVSWSERPGHQPGNARRPSARVGDWNQQWLNLRYVTRLLVRLGANEDAVALHHALLAAGKPSPLTAEQVSSAPGQDGSGLAGAQAVARALSALQSASKSV